jgi:hypothetical protein
MTANRTISLAVVCSVALVAGCEVAMSDADRAFDAALTAALVQDRPIDLTQLEPGGWSRVCAVGEDRPASMFPGERPRPGEAAFDTLIDAAFLPAGQADAGALAFAYPDGVEVRQTAVLVDTPEAGWRFRDYPAGTD